MGSKLKVEKWNSDSDGQLCLENMEKKLSEQGYSFTQYEFPPGTNFPNHTHGISKKDSIISGRFQFSMFGETVVLEPGDMVEEPLNTVHNAKVVGNSNVVFYDATVTR